MARQFDHRGDRWRVGFAARGHLVVVGRGIITLSLTVAGRRLAFVIANVEQLFSVGIVVSEHVELDGRVFVDAGKETSAVDLEQHGSEFGTGQPSPSAATRAAALQRHSAASRCRELEQNVVGGATLVGDHRLDLPHAWRRDLDGTDFLTGPFEVGRLKEMEKTFCKAGHAGRVEQGGQSA